MKSINLVIKNDERHCMPHLYIHATLYSMHRLVVPSGNKNLRGSIYIYIYIFNKAVIMRKVIVDTLLLY